MRQIADDEFRFRHLLIRDAAYESMPKQVRGVLHERFAEWAASGASRSGWRPSSTSSSATTSSRRMPTASRSGPAGPVEEELAAGRAAERLAVAGRRALAREDVRRRRSS